MITIEQLKEIQLRADKLKQYLAIDEKRVQLEEEELRTQDPGFWEDAKAAHELCTHHREALKNAVRCGCFYCKRIYDPREITAWIDRHDTALCPYCGIDSVIPETEEYPLTTAFLKKMYHVWFT